MSLRKRMFKALQKTANVYEDYGYKNRREYLEGLAEENGVPVEHVFALAQVLGPDEDFDALVTEIEEHGERLFDQEMNAKPAMENYVFNESDFEDDQLKIMDEYYMGFWTQEQKNTIHPNFSPEQIKILLDAFNNKFTAEDVKSFADPSLSVEEMTERMTEKMDDVQYLQWLEVSNSTDEAFEESQKELGEKYPELPKLDPEQSWVILHALEEGMPFDEVKKIAKPFISSNAMLEKFYDFKYPLSEYEESLEKEEENK